MGHNLYLEQSRKQSIVFWIPLLRGILVIVLGLSLLFIPDKAPHAGEHDGIVLD